MTDWSALIRDHGPLVWRTVYRLLDHEADAQDCFQQTFLAAVEQESRVTIRHWPAVLKRIATARALDRLRERYRSAKRAETLADEPADARLSTAFDEASEGELVEHLRMALTEIDPRQAEAFVLIVVEGQTYDDAALAMTVTANHVGVLLNRAKAALRERLTAFAPTGDRP